jgi:urea carboxylase
MWNRYRQTADFRDGRQWLLRFFDQIRFYPVSAPELSQMREDFPHGRFALRIEETTLRLAEHRQFLTEHARQIAHFKARQQAAFNAERERWRVSGTATFESDSIALPTPEAPLPDVPTGCLAIASPVTGSLWQVCVTPADRVQPGDTLLIVEAMKMEVPIVAEQLAEVVEVRCARGRAVSAGDALLILRPL